MAIRDARPADVDELGDVHVRAWQAAYRGVMPDAYLDGLDLNDRTAMWAGFFSRGQPDRRLKVITVERGVVGFACFGASPEQADELLGELFAINLDPEHWALGLGRALLLEVMDELVPFGKEAVLWVIPENARARGLYESEGWVDDGGRRHDVVLGAHLDHMRYRVALRQ